MDTLPAAIESIIFKLALGFLFRHKKQRADSDKLYTVGAQLIEAAIATDPEVLDRMGLPAVCAISEAVTVGDGLATGKALPSPKTLSDPYPTIQPRHTNVLNWVDALVRDLELIEKGHLPAAPLTFTRLSQWQRLRRFLDRDRDLTY